MYPWKCHLAQRKNITHSDQISSELRAPTGSNGYSGDTFPNASLQNNTLSWITQALWNVKGHFNADVGPNWSTRENLPITSTFDWLLLEFNLDCRFGFLPSDIDFKPCSSSPDNKSFTWFATRIITHSSDIQTGRLSIERFAYAQIKTHSLRSRIFKKSHFASRSQLFVNLART